MTLHNVRSDICVNLAHPRCECGLLAEVKIPGLGWLCHLCAEESVACLPTNQCATVPPVSDQ